MDFMGLPCDKDAEATLIFTVLEFPYELDRIRHFTPDYFQDTELRAAFIELLREDALGIAKPNTHPDIMQYCIMKYGTESLPSIYLQENIERVERAYRARIAFVKAGDIAKYAARGDIEKMNALVEEFHLPASQFGSTTMAKAASEFADNLAKPIEYLRTGFFVDKWKILRKEELVILAARPGMGKSSWAIQAGCNVARSGKKVLFISLEMAASQIAARASEAMAGISHWDESEDSKSKLAASAAKLMEMENLIILDYDMTSSELLAKARAIGNIDLIISDHLGLFLDTAENETIRNGKISRMHKKIAKELQIPVILITQLNRDVERRKNKRPLLSDLRGSGKIEQDADQVICIYRDAYYEQDMDNQTGEAEIYCVKSRNSSMWGGKMLYNQGKGARFEDIDLPEEPMGYPYNGDR